MQTPVRIRPAASFPLKFNELESSGVHHVHWRPFVKLSVKLSNRWLAGGAMRLTQVRGGPGGAVCGPRTEARPLGIIRRDFLLQSPDGSSVTRSVL